MNDSNSISILPALSERLEAILTADDANLQSVGQQLTLLYESTDDPQAHALCDATWNAVVALNHVGKEALDVAKQAVETASAALTRSDQLREAHNALMSDLKGLNTDNPLVERVYEAAEQEVYEYIYEGDGIHTDDPANSALEGGNVDPELDPDTIDTFLYTVLGQYGGYELPPEMVEELSAFIRDFTDRAEIAERAAREERERRWQEQRAQQQQQGGAS